VRPTKGEIRNQLIRNQLIRSQLIWNQLVRNQLIRSQLIWNQLVRHLLIWRRGIGNRTVHHNQVRPRPLILVGAALILRIGVSVGPRYSLFTSGQQHHKPEDPRSPYNMAHENLGF